LILAGAVGARADQTFDKAKQEKKAVWYTSIPLGTAQGLCNAFNAKKLGVECEVHRDGSGKLYSRWIQEAKSGIYTADVLHTSDLSHFIELKKLNALAAYRPRGTDKFNPAFWEKENYWGVLRASVYQPAYNTNKVKAEDVPKSWKDFLDPKWQGKLVNAHPSYSGVVSEGLGVLVDLLGLGLPGQIGGPKAPHCAIVRGHRHLCRPRGGSVVRGRQQQRSLQRHQEGRAHQGNLSGGGPAVHRIAERDHGQGASPQCSPSVHGLVVQHGGPTVHGE
jgi:hypothetical protein